MSRWPVYVVSKGRWGSRLTSRTLEAMGQPYLVVVEAQEFEKYSAVIDPTNLLVLDPAYWRDYDTCDDLGDTKGKGPGPARNFVWDHALDAGATWHWVMDDNIRGFYRWHCNAIHRVLDAAPFACMEDFSERYDNLAMAGPNYEKFAKRKSVRSVIVLNTRIYSCNLIRTGLPFRWRARYNEDTDLSLRLLKAGYCTIQFNAFLQGKVATQTMRGGNTDEFYAKEGTLEKSKMLVRLHPDVARLVWKFGRWHHYVDYRPFKKNQLRLRSDIEIPQGVNNYGMQLVNVAAPALQQAAG